MKSIEFDFDFSSPNCYVALAKLDEIKKRKEVEVIYSPIFLGGLFKSTNDAPIPLGTLEFNYMERNLQRLSRKLGVGFHFSHERFPVNSLKSMRGFYFAKSLGRELEYLHRLFQACWADNLDIADGPTLKGIVESLGFDHSLYVEFTEKDETKQKLRADTQRALERGVFGAPTFFLDGEMYWGSPEVLWYLDTML